MRVAIYNPYLDTLGGGERYTAGVIKVFSEKGYKVEVEWKDQDIAAKLEKRFGVKLPGIKVVKSVNRGDGYDACFWVSDGSVPTLRSRNNILHFQVPFKNVNGKSLINRMKMFRIKSVVCNSEFTKRIIDKEFGVNSVLIYPPVSTLSFKHRKKENIIVYIGRFSKLTQQKRQDVLVEVFKNFYPENKDWKLILAGGSEIGKDTMVKDLEEMASGYPVEIIESPDFSKIKEILGKAKIFWSASGYGVDEELNPKQVEHFGITVVEAMAAGAVPLVVAKGGHGEIIENSETGYLWSKKSELLAHTRKLANNPKLLQKIARKAEEASSLFSEAKFSTSFSSLIN